jgi:Cu2+-containing amine oxidase
MCGGGLWLVVRQRDASVVDRDLVVWNVFGAHHVPRTEEWPLMPAEEVRPQYVDGGGGSSHK